MTNPIKSSIRAFAVSMVIFAVVFAGILTMLTLADYLGARWVVWVFVGVGGVCLLIPPVIGYVDATNNEGRL